MKIEEQLRYYPSILELAFLVINSLKGKSLSDPKGLACEHLATKIFLHASTMSHLQYGSNVILSSHPQGTHVYDFASMLVIARAIYDTYLNLFEIAFEELDDDIFEYRHAVYELKGFKTRELLLQEYTAVEEETEYLKILRQKVQDVEMLRDRIRKTLFYSTLNPDQQKATLNGKLYPACSPKERAKAAGFNETLSWKISSYLSAYVHGDALSGAQIGSAEDAEVRDYIHVSLQLTQVILSKLIVNYVKKFPDASKVAENNIEIFTIATGFANMSTKEW